MRFNGIVGSIAVLLVIVTAALATVAGAEGAPAAEVATIVVEAAPQTTAVPTPIAPQSNQKFWLTVMSIALIIILLTTVVIRRTNRT